MDEEVNLPSRNLTFLLLNEVVFVGFVDVNQM